MYPHWQRYWPLATKPTLSTVQIPEVGIRMSPGMSDGSFGDAFTSFADDQIRTNESRPGRVSERHEEKKTEKKKTLTVDVISVSRVKKVLFEEPIRHSIRETRTTSGSVTPTCSALPVHPTVNHHIFRRSS
jgi:hypothetical protein